MALLKGAALDRFLKRPDKTFRVVLVFGPDEGLVAERARGIVTAASGAKDDPFSLVRLSGAEVAADPARLIDEAATVSLFGDRRVVWVREIGTRNLAPAVAPLLDRADLDSLVVLEAGDLKKGPGLRQLAETHARALAIPCYADSPEEIGRLIDEEIGRAGLRIESAAREMLESALGADRLMSRAEMQKLCLYAHGTGTIRPEDVTAIVGDAFSVEQDEVLDAAGLGQIDKALAALARLRATGASPASVAAAALRHGQTLHRLAGAVADGARPEAAVDGVRPPVLFRRRAALVAQARAWSVGQAERALLILDKLVLDTRRRPDLAEALLAEALIAVAQLVRPGAKRVSAG